MLPDRGIRVVRVACVLFSLDGYFSCRLLRVIGIVLISRGPDFTLAQTIAWRTILIDLHGPSVFVFRVVFIHEFVAADFLVFGFLISVVRERSAEDRREWEGEGGGRKEGKRG